MGPLAGLFWVRFIIDPIPMDNGIGPAPLVLFFVFDVFSYIRYILSSAELVLVLVSFYFLFSFIGLRGGGSSNIVPPSVSAVYKLNPRMWAGIP